MIRTFFFGMFSLFFAINIYSVPPETIQNAGILYKKEKSGIRNYRVKQLVLSKIQSPSQTIIEKRFQVGYFLSPDKFLFLIKEKWINGQQIPLTKEEVEKSTKRDIDWLSPKGMQEYTFKFLAGDETVSRFQVISPKKDRDWYNGEIWIHPISYRILKIVKEPSLFPVGYERFRTELFFDPNLPHQEPYLSKLEAVFTNEKGEKTQAYVDASFSDYEFNVNLNSMK
jgi:hypothetical protein